MILAEVKAKHQQHPTTLLVVTHRLIIFLPFILLQWINAPMVLAQLPVTIAMISNSSGSDQRVYSVVIPIAQLKTINNRWNNYIGFNAYGWESERDGIHVQRGIIDTSISEKKFAIASELAIIPTGVRLNLWLSQRGCPLVNASTEAKLDIAIKKYVQVFADSQYKKGIHTQLKEDQCLKKKMERNLAALHRHQGRPKCVLSHEEYQAQAAAITKSIDEQDAKVQALTALLHTTL